MDSLIDMLAGEAFSQGLASDPFSATLLGLRDFAAEVPDLSEEAERRQRADLGEVSRRLEEIDARRLSQQDRVTHAMLLLHCRDRRAALDARWHDFAASAFFTSAPAKVLQFVPKVSLEEPEHARVYLDRCGKLGRYLDQAAQRLGDGVADGRTPPARAVRASIAQLDAYLEAGVEADPLCAPAPPEGWAGAEAWRRQLAHVVETTARPAMRRHRDFLEDEVLPWSRPEERSGVVWLEDGASLYAEAIREHTTVERSADDLHRTGLDIVGALADEYRSLSKGALGTADLREIFGRLRTDPALRFQTSREVRAVAEEALRRADERLPEWFGRLPTAPCEVRDMPAFEVKDGTIAYYQPPSTDGSRPGIYWVNTSEPTTRGRFEAEAVAFHESVPGHHLQVVLAQELTLPRFRRLSLSTAYVEGWALYTERLADEMGLYSGNLARLGMLSLDSLRACRLVVDTGLHALGWHRQQAVDFMRDNSPHALNSIDNEVDRYISWPGQALGYMVGRLELNRLRDQAQAALGGAFDIRGFHDVVLGSGAVPLPVLDDIVREWTQGLR